MNLHAWMFDISRMRLLSTVQRRCAGKCMIETDKHHVLLLSISSCSVQVMIERVGS